MRPYASSIPITFLLSLTLLEHAIELLVRRIAASLGRLCSLESLVRSALGSRSSLLSLSSRALRAIRRVLRSLCGSFDRVEIFLRYLRCTAGHHRKAADERRCPQSSLDFCGH
jgi:hypothetical protein